MLICVSLCLSLSLSLPPSQELTHASAKHRVLENRQQRIGELRARYQGLRKELEQTKQHLMLEPHQWTSECESHSTVRSATHRPFERLRVQTLPSAIVPIGILWERSLSPICLIAF